MLPAESEVRLIKRARELNAEIVANAAKVQTALKLNEEDQGTIAALKKEIEKAWKMVDASHEKEAKAKETIQQLKMEIANLTRLVEQGSGLALGEEATLNDLIKQKEELVRERDAQVDQIMGLRSELMDTQVCVWVWGACGQGARVWGAGVWALHTHVCGVFCLAWCMLDSACAHTHMRARTHTHTPQEKLRLAENNRITLEGDIATLKDSVAEKRMEAEREARKKERMEKEMKELRISLEARQSEIKAKQQQVCAGLG